MNKEAIVRELKTISKQAADAIKQRCITLHQKSLQEQAQIQKINRHQYLMGMLFDIQFELYCIMNGSHYSFLAPINAPQNIRIKSYEIAPQGVVFSYLLPVNTPIPSITHMSALKNNINTDIYQYQQQILYNDGYDLSMINHPYITSGLYVTDIQPLAADIVIKVVTKYYP